MQAYEADFYAWLNATAAAVEEGRFSDIDRANLAEELRDMGKSERRRLDSFLERILLHLLKIRYQPDKHSRSWDTSIEDSRMRIERELKESPSLGREIPCMVQSAYQHARLAANQQTGLARRTFPLECPFSLEEILGMGRKEGEET